MNTDKLYAQQLASDYAPKDTSRVTALRTGDALSARPAANFTYALFRGVTGALAGSVWSLSLAAYHLVLGVMRDESLLYIQGDPRVHPGYAMKKDRPSGGLFCVLMLFPAQRGSHLQNPLQ